MAELDASYELMVALIARLKADPTVAGFVGARIYDRPPQKTSGEVDAASPYISFGATTSIPDDYDCAYGEEITVQIDIWSWGSGEAFSSAQARKIAGAVKRCLHNKDVSLSVNAPVTLQHELTRVMRDPDGVTNHAAVQFSAVVETP